MTDEYPPPPGCIWQWCPDNDLLHGWRVATDEEAETRRCRAMAPSRPGCPNRVVAFLNRGHRRAGRSYDAWWPYCADHLYGRRIENGMVMVRRAVKALQ